MNGVWDEQIGLLEDFARKSGFRHFYAEHDSVYRALAEEYRSEIDLAAMRRWLEENFSARWNSFRIVFSPLIGASHSAHRFEPEGFREAVMLTASPSMVYSRVEDPALRGPELARMLFTELDHLYVNPASDRQQDAIDRAFADLAFWTTGEHYDNAYLVFNEYMTWAVFLLWAEDTYDTLVFGRTKESVTDAMTGYRRFPEFDAFFRAVSLSRDPGVGGRPCAEPWYPMTSLTPLRSLSLLGLLLGTLATGFAACSGGQSGQSSADNPESPHADESALPNSGEPALLVLNKADDEAVLIDPVTYQILASFPTGRGPHEGAVSPDGRTAFVTDYGDETPGHTITVLDLAGRRVATTWDLGDYTRPHGIAVSSDGELVWVTAEGAGAVLELDARTGAIRSAWPTGQEVSHMLVPLPDGAVTAFQCGFATATGNHPEEGDCTLPAGDYFLWINDFSNEGAGDTRPTNYSIEITVVE